MVLEEAGEIIAFAMGHFEQYDDGVAYACAREKAQNL